MIIDLQRYWGEREIYYPGELAAKITDSMQKDNWTLLRSKECRNAELSGLFELLDQVCFYWKWKKSKITLETGNLWTKHPEYNIKYVNYYAAIPFEKDLLNLIHKPWNREKSYGMFIGRANVTRLHAAHKHKKFEFGHQGLTSFNQDIKHYIDRQCLLDYLCETNTTFDKAIDIDPYSDIDHVKPPPITSNHTAGNLWNNVYEKIAIEIVCETAEDEKSFSITEKILRPILYKRPFLLIAAPGAIDFYKNLKNIISTVDFFNPDGTHVNTVLNLKFFENVIPIDYDSYGGIHRVDYVFDILHELIRTNKISTIIKDCNSDIEHNYNEILRVINIHRSQKNYFDQLFTTSDWDRPEYAKYK